MTKHRATEQQLAEEARQWDRKELTPRDWQETPEAVPRADESVSISIRLPRTMLTILKEFAAREGIGYQVLMKRWLEQRVREERERLFPATQVRLKQPRLIREAAGFVGLVGDKVSDKANVGEIGLVVDQITELKK